MPRLIWLPSAWTSILSVTVSVPSLAMRMLLWKSRILSAAQAGKANARNIRNFKSSAHSVAAGFLRAVERLVGRLEDLVRRERAFGRPCGADRDRDRQQLVGRPSAAALAALGRLLRPVL